MADFTEILGKKAAEVEKPKPRPAGPYLCALVGLPNQKEAKENLMLEFKLKLLAPQAGQDLSDQPDISSWAPIKYTVFVNEEYPLKRFLTEVLGIDPGPEKNSKSLGEMVAESPGRQLIGVVSHRPYIQDGQPELATEIKQVAKV